YLATNQAVGSSNLSGRTITPKQQASACCFFMRVFWQGCALHLQMLQAKASQAKPRQQQRQKLAFRGLAGRCRSAGTP
ncbi:hypothetical protein, partial [Stenotrophomonas forensis]|uniref:hypothetical protein n=1 Tax=Stenotrophomonas forensis TaxID=2871169 RepID=UPI0039C62985